jgi:hypothetical protein
LQKLLAIRFGHNGDASQSGQPPLAGRLGVVAQGSMLFEPHNFTAYKLEFSCESSSPVEVDF